MDRDNKIQDRTISIMDCYPSTMLDEKVNNLAQKTRDFGQDCHVIQNIQNNEVNSGGNTNANNNPLGMLLNNLSNGASGGIINNLINNMGGDNIITSLLNNGNNSMPLIAMLKNMMGSNNVNISKNKNSGENIEGDKKISDYKKVEQ